MRSWGILLGAVGVVLASPSCSSGSKTSPADTQKGATAGGGTSGGGSSTGGSGSSTGGSGSSTGGSGSSTGGGGADCIGSSVLSTLGKSRLMVGGSMAATTASAAPFDLQYVYLSSGIPDGPTSCVSCASGCTVQGTSCAGGACSWWGCWQNDAQAPGDYVRSFISSCQAETPPQIPMFTYYEIFQSSGVSEGAAEVTQAATDASFMARYFGDWRFVLQQIGANVVLLHIEPDFWGFAEQITNDPTSLPAAVASANATDCGSMPNTIAGMGQCMIAMTRKYAPNSLVGLHDSAWSTNVTVTANTDPSFDVTAPANATAAFLAACGESQADFVVVETSDHDSGYLQSIGETNVWWDATNMTLPDFHQDFAYVKAVTEALNKPALYWQTPLGNANQNNTPNHWQDNRVDYFFSHMDELAGAHAIGAAFGAGGIQTLPETDGGNFVAKANAYFSGGGQSLCP